MSQASCRPHVRLDLSPHEFKLLIRSLTGALREDEDLQAADDLGLHLLDQYVRSEKERIRQLSGVLSRLKNAREAEEVPEVPERQIVPVTILRAGSEPLGRYSHR